MAIMAVSIDETAKKAVVCAGIPDNSDKCKQLNAKYWLSEALGPLNGKGGGKGNLAQGQGPGISYVDEAMNIAASFASMKLH